MAATYNEHILTDLDWIRAQLGDTDVSDPDLAWHSDEHITVVLDTWPDRRAMALAQLASELVSRQSLDPESIRLPNGIGVTSNQILTTWRRLAEPYYAWLADEATRKPATSSGSTARPGSMFGLARARR